MRIPSKGRIAVCAMMDLAIGQDQKPMTIAEMAESQDVSVSYLEQLFSDLRSAGLVVGVRGPGGGYRLGDSSEKISIAQIINAIDDKALKTDKVNQEYLPDLLWSDFVNLAHDFLDNLMLASLVNKTDEKAASPESGSTRHAELVAL